MQPEDGRHVTHVELSGVLKKVSGRMGPRNPRRAYDQEGREIALMTLANMRALGAEPQHWRGHRASR